MLMYRHVVSERPCILVLGEDPEALNETIRALKRCGFSDVRSQAQLEVAAVAPQPVTQSHTERHPERHSERHPERHPERHSDSQGRVEEAKAQPNDSASDARTPGHEPAVATKAGGRERQLSESGPPGSISASASPAAPDVIPNAIIVVGDMNLCAQARTRFVDVPIIAIPQAQQTTVALAAGADDVAQRPIDAPVLATRVRRLLAASVCHHRVAELELLQEALLDIHRIGHGDGDSPAALRRGLLRAVEVMGFDRAVVVVQSEGSELVHVLASTNDPNLSRFSLSIERYPELQAAISRRQPVLIEDALTDPLMQSEAEVLARKDIRAMAVFPALWNGKVVGAVMYRSRRPGIDQVDKNRLGFGMMFAKHVAARLIHGRVLDSLREETQRIARARFDAERRTRTIDSLRDHFEAAADGILVLSGNGKILFVNRAAEQLTGFARDGLVQRDIAILVPAEQCSAVHEVVKQVLSGQNVEAFDLDLATTSDEYLRASVTTSTLLSHSEAAILSFRDVSAERALERQLRKTKKFLERLIDSAVDAVVAADMRGRIIIFNKGAERVFGYSADEVLHRIPVWQLYAAEMPRKVMRKLRSTQNGGVGRIDQMRHQVRAKDGEPVPVNMTASIIYEDGKEIATVGIFSDLRDRIRIEKRLLLAQKKLQQSEKQAMLAGVAGTAAHELNQPLQAILTRTEMLQRQIPQDATYMRYLKDILSDVMRMADIVRKIRDITKYETKPYFDTHIVDLERATIAPDDDFDVGEAEPFEGGVTEIDSEFAAEQEHQMTIAHVELEDVLSEDEIDSELGRGDTVVGPSLIESDPAISPHGLPQGPPPAATPAPTPHGIGHHQGSGRREREYRQTDGLLDSGRSQRHDNVSDNVHSLSLQRARNAATAAGSEARTRAPTQREIRRRALTRGATVRDAPLSVADELVSAEASDASIDASRDASRDASGDASGDEEVGKVRGDGGIENHARGEEDGDLFGVAVGDVGVEWPSSPGPGSAMLRQSAMGEKGNRDGG